jgi:hypothetical protein
MFIHGASNKAGKRSVEAPPWRKNHWSARTVSNIVKELDREVEKFHRGG